MTVKANELQNPTAERGADPNGDEWPSVPLWNLSARHQSDSAGGPEAGRTRMRTLASGNTFPRRDLLKAGGALLIGVAIGKRARAQEPDGVALVSGPDQPGSKKPRHLDCHPRR